MSNKWGYLGMSVAIVVVGGAVLSEYLTRQDKLNNTQEQCVVVHSPELPSNYVVKICEVYGDSD